ncbi:glycosyltransferase [Ochrobactrum soli]|nr:glycosyltransferase [[Ochrobactrum] soli]
MPAEKFIMPLPGHFDKRDYDNFNQPHPYVCTPQWNFGVNAEARIINDIFNDGLTSDIIWQPDTYHSAKSYAESIDAKRVIDIGCGSALKLKSLFSGTGSDVFAVDFKGSLAAAIENYAEASHVECDLTSWNEVLNVAKKFRNDVPTVIICADVIEHIPDPRPLLAFIRLLLSGNPKSRCFLSTPDRSRLGYQSLTAKPANPAHVREWTAGELRNLLMASGFHVENIGNIGANEHDEAASTILADISFDAKFYAGTLARYGINSVDVTSVMITTEYPGLIASGGIGTFVADWHRSTKGSAVLAAFDFDKEKTQNGDVVLSPSGVIDVSEIGEIGTADVLLQAATQFLFLCPDMREIHFQEYLGIGMRIAQAKMAGVLPDTLTIVAHCHGNQHYLENANQTWMGADSQIYAVREKISIELADFVVFPSEFLRKFYVQSGIQIDDSKIIICPYRYTNIKIDSSPFDNVKRIVFVGKFIPMKGFDLFCASLDDSFCKELKAKGIEEITLIGRGPDTGYEHERVLKHHFALTVHTGFDHAQLVSYIQGHRSDSLFVQPYRGDNFPLAVYDVIGNGGVLLAGNAGGIPEMFRDKDWRECLADLSPDSLRYKIREILDWDNEKKARIRDTLVEDLRRGNRVSENQRYIPVASQPVELLSSTVMIPFYNTEISEFIELLKALNQQSLRPSEVIIVNDASNYKSRTDMAEAVQRYLDIPFRIIDHAYNCGLAGARNTALSACTTDLILNADSDDIPLNDWVKTIVTAMSRNPQAAAAVPYLAAFDAGTDFNRPFHKGQYVYRPMGDGFVTSQTRNDLGHANSGYRVSHARGMGGWNAGSKAKYEDWAFFLNILANGLRIELIPTVTCLYRVRKNSMARTYSEWPGQVRLYQTTNGLSRFETLQLQRHCRSETSLGGDPAKVGIERVMELQKQIEAFERRKVIRIVNAMSAQVQKLPFLHKLLRRLGRLVGLLR